MVDYKFVKEPVKFSNQTTAFGQDLNGFSSAPQKGSFLLTQISVLLLRKSSTDISCESNG